MINYFVFNVFSLFLAILVNQHIIQDKVTNKKTIMYVISTLLGHLPMSSTCRVEGGENASACFLYIPVDHPRVIVLFAKCR